MGVRFIMLLIKWKKGLLGNVLVRIIVVLVKELGLKIFGDGGID